MTLGTFFENTGYILFIILLAIVLYKKYKTILISGKKENLDVIEFLTSISDKIIELCQSHIIVMNSKRNKYNSDLEFKKALASNVAIELKKWINLVFENNEKELQELLTQEVLEGFVYTIINIHNLLDENIEYLSDNN